MAMMAAGDSYPIGMSKPILQNSECVDLSLSLPQPRPASDTPVNTVEPLMHKNLLQEHTQRSYMALPIYHNVNEGMSHCPKFRSSVIVDGITYTSPNTFLNRKAAEQDVSKYAMDCILNKIHEEKCSFLFEDASLCKSILNEFSVKKNLEMPVYTTSSPTGKRKFYIASMAFNGKTYNGDISQSKKMAEQYAARSAINTLLGKLESGKQLYEIIKSKSVKFPEILKPQHSSGSQVSCEVADGDTIEAPEPPPSLVIVPQVGHAFKKPKLETTATAAASTAAAAAEAGRSLPIIFVPEQQQQQINLPPSLQKPVTVDRREKNRKTKMRKKRRAMKLLSGGGSGAGGVQPFQPVEQNA